VSAQGRRLPVVKRPVCLQGPRSSTATPRPVRNVHSRTHQSLAGNDTPPKSGDFGYFRQGKNQTGLGITSKPCHTKTRDAQQAPLLAPLRFTLDDFSEMRGADRLGGSPIGFASVASSHAGAKNPAIGMPPNSQQTSPIHWPGRLARHPRSADRWEMARHVRFAHPTRIGWPIPPGNPPTQRDGLVRLPHRQPAVGSASENGGFPTIGRPAPCRQPPSANPSRRC